jgi:hypothetical protein
MAIKKTQIEVLNSNIKKKISTINMFNDISNQFKEFINKIKLN